MPYDPNQHHRRSVRLDRFDYSQDGAYFVTVCAHERQPLFGRLVAGEAGVTVDLSEAGLAA